MPEARMAHFLPEPVLCKITIFENSKKIISEGRIMHRHGGIFTL